MRIRNRVIIEFTTATGKRSVGDRMAVDPMSATTFVDKLKVAVRVDDAKPAKKAAPKLVPAPAPEAAPAPVLVDFGDDDFAA
jgi:hypothetical protein